MQKETIEKHLTKAQLTDLEERLTETTSIVNALIYANKEKDKFTDALMADIEQLKKDKLRLENNIKILQLKNPLIVFKD